MGKTTFEEFLATDVDVETNNQFGHARSCANRKTPRLGESAGSGGSCGSKLEELTEGDGFGKELSAGLDGWGAGFCVWEDTQALVTISDECGGPERRGETLRDISLVGKHPSMFNMVERCPESSLLEEASLI